MQRRSHRLLYFSIRRCVSLCAISSSQRQCSAAEIPRHLAPFSAVERSAIHPRQGSSDLFDLRPRGNLHTLPWFGLHGREHAWAVHGRLREILPEDGYPLGKHAGWSTKKLHGPVNPNSGGRVRFVDATRLSARRASSVTKVRKYA